MCVQKFRDGWVPSFNIRTDLALEAREIVQGHSNVGIPGVVSETLPEDGITVSRVRVETVEAARQLGKTPGRYVTLEAPGLRQKDTDLQDRLSELFARELLALLPMPEDLDQPVLVIGLGNWNVTPDALGPRVINDLLVTRHVMQPGRHALSEGFRSVCALSPGVMGITGIETAEIIQAIVSKVKPALLIAVDALAAHRIERLHTTIQVADSGIHPGSGVGNNRLGINRENMGVPVVAIGVPTVVDASTIAGQAMDALIESLRREAVAGILADTLEKLNREQRQVMVREVLEPYAGQLMVTPKEIDAFIADVALVIAAGLNAALHEKVKADEPGKYMQ